MACCKNVGGAPASALGGALGGDRGDDRPCQFTAAEKGKKVVNKKRKITDREVEIARAVAAAAEVAEAGGHRGSLQIGSKLSSAQRRAVL
jgi:hypothetical protein